MMLSYSSTPVQELFDDTFSKAGVRLIVKREDLNHPDVSGNKWWKLKYNLEAALEQGKDTLLTYGGAFSNHIYATAAASKLCGLKSIGIIRGEEVLPLNPVLKFASDNGMLLRYVSREMYKTKSGDVDFNNLQREFGDFYVIPEGGSNSLAVKGVVELGLTLGEDFDYLCCAVGTGATLAGLVSAMAGRKIVMGFMVLKGSGWEKEIESFNPGNANWRLIHDYHEGGYAKNNESLNKFMEDFMLQHNLPLEHVYTGKLFKGITDLISKGYFPEGSKILALHSGGIHKSQVASP